MKTFSLDVQVAKDASGPWFSIFNFQEMQIFQGLVTNTDTSAFFMRVAPQFDVQDYTPIVKVDFKKK